MQTYEPLTGMTTCKEGGSYVDTADHEADKQAALEKSLSETSITVHILRNWDREKIESFCNHLLGDNSQEKASALAELEKENGRLRGVLEQLADDKGESYWTKEEVIKIAREALKKEGKG